MNSLDILGADIASFIIVTSDAQACWENSALYTFVVSCTQIGSRISNLVCVYLYSCDGRHFVSRLVYTSDTIGLVVEPCFLCTLLKSIELSRMQMKFNGLLNTCMPWISLRLRHLG